MNRTQKGKGQNIVVSAGDEVEMCVALVEMFMIVLGFYPEKKYEKIQKKSQNAPDSSCTSDALLCRLDFESAL